TQASLAQVAFAAAAQASSVRRIAVVDEVAGDMPGNAMPFEAFSSLHSPGAAARRPAVSDIDLALRVYTAGSNGNPKGVMMTHRNIECAASSITTYLQSRSDDVVLSVLPLSFDYGLYQLLMCVKMGATLVLEKSFAFPQKVLPLLASE